MFFYYFFTIFMCWFIFFVYVKALLMGGCANLQLFCITNFRNFCLRILINFTDSKKKLLTQ